MNGISLFTGSGIGELALKQIIPRYRTVCYVEWDKYCQKLIQARIRDGVLDDAPIWDDARTFDGKQWFGKVDFVSGGFPCQPFSIAGKNMGAEDERNLWPDTFRIIDEVRPKYAFLENVPNIFNHQYIRRIFGDLAEIGYDCEWDIISASSVGALHKRNRLWILAYPAGVRRKKGCDITREKPQETWRDKFAVGGETLANAERIGELQPQRSQQDKRGRTSNSSWWDTEPNVGRVAYGVANRVDRLKALGNGWVPQVVRRIIEFNEKE